MRQNRTLMRWIVQSSLKFRYLVVFGAVGMVAAGSFLIPQMRVDILAPLDRRTGPHVLAIVLAGFVVMALLSRPLGELKSP